MIELYKRDVMESLLKLRRDAIARGMIDIALVYGQSAIRLGMEILSDRIKKEQ